MPQTHPDPIDPALTGPQAAAQLAARGTSVAPGEPGKPFANMLCFSVYAAQLAFNRLYKQLLAPRADLSAISGAGGAGPGGGPHGGRTGRSAVPGINTLTPLLKRMEAAGLVSRRRDSADERVVRVALAPAGAAVVAQVECVPLDVLAAIDLPLGDLHQMKSAIDRLSQELRKTPA
jgi:hypothetical protein